MSKRAFESLIDRPALLAALAGALGMAPAIFHPEAGWDTGTHLSHASFLLRNGPGIPHWNPEWFRGIPFLLYYPPLTSLIVAWAGRLVGLVPAYVALTIAVGAGLLSAAAALAQAIFRSRAAGLAAAAVLASTGIFWGGFYVEGHLPNHLAACFLLWSLLLLHRCFSGERRWLWPAAILLGLMILAHHMTAVVAAPIVALLFCAAPGGPRRWLLPSLAAAGLAVCVAAWYCLPLADAILAGEASFAPASYFTPWITRVSWLVGRRPTFYTLAGFGGLALPAALAPLAFALAPVRRRGAAPPRWSLFYTGTGLCLMVLAVTGLHLWAGIAIPPYRLKIFAALFLAVGSSGAIAALARLLGPSAERRALATLAATGAALGTLCVAFILALSPYWDRGAPSRELARAAAAKPGEILVICDDGCGKDENATTLFLNAYGEAWQYDGGAPDGFLDRIWKDLDLRRELATLAAPEQVAPLREKGVDLLFLVRPSPPTLHSYLAAGFRPRLRDRSCALLEVPGHGSGPARVEGDGAVSIREVRPDRIAVAVTGATPATVVRLQTRADRFWRVHDGAGRSVPMTSWKGFAAARPGLTGEYDLVFSYRNPLRARGLAVTIASLGLGLAVWKWASGGGTPR